MTLVLIGILQIKIYTSICDSQSSVAFILEQNRELGNLRFYICRKLSIANSLYRIEIAHYRVLLGNSDRPKVKACCFGHSYLGCIHVTVLAYNQMKIKHFKRILSVINHLYLFCFL